jgi:adenylyltransferase/sulfurtransferase
MEEVTNEEIERYHRQILLTELGLEGQKKLKSSKVLVIGAGGLGSPILLYLAGAGVGTLGIIDGDNIETINLHRQVIHQSTNTSQNKAISAREAVLRLNPLITVRVYTEWLTSQSSRLIVPDYDILVIATDNAESRYLISDLGVFYNKPVVSGSCVRWDGQLTVFYQGPCLRCIFPVPTPRKALTRAADVGVLGPVPGVIGTLQAVEVIKIILGMEVMTGKMMVYDGVLVKFRVFSTRGKNPDCPACCGKINPHEFDYGAFITPPPEIQIDEKLGIRPSDLKPLLKTHQIDLIDLRAPNHFLISHIPGSRNIPSYNIDSFQLHESPNSLIFLDRNGAVALEVAQKIHNQGNECSYLIGGLEAWKSENPEFILF